MTKTIPANQLWFINTLVTVRVSISDGQDGISVLEHRAPYGFSPPLHLHRTEDEVFHVLEGEFRLKLQDQERRVGPGDILLAPKGFPHTYRVESAQGGRCLTITAGGDFERFVRAMSRPAERPEFCMTETVSSARPSIGPSNWEMSNRSHCRPGVPI